MKIAHFLAMTSAGLTAIVATPAMAATSLVNFDPPNFAQGPSTFVAAGAQQTITTTAATFTGGVLLGFATFFPAISFASAPNVYGTANFGIGLSQTLDIAINPGFATNRVSFALFNGETFAQSYRATAFDGANMVGSQTLANVAANFNSGYGLIDLQFANITRVSIAAIGNPAVWDFLIDSVAFNQSVAQGVSSGPPPVIPPPPVFVPPPPVVVTQDDGTEIELELNYGDSNDGRATLHSLMNAPVPAPVPEPAIWLQMIVGFGAIGLLQSRKVRRQIAA
ncbi:MAG: hypothetical protein RL490_883 [Pseudomonadota bacterium]|jgi:hypothetical protein